MDKVGITAMILIVLSLLTFTGSFIYMNIFASNKDTYPELKPAITGITIANGAALFLLIVGTLIYFTRFPAYAQLVNFGMAGVAMFMSLMAVSISVLTKVYS
jgi:hypothetical protein